MSCFCLSPPAFLVLVRRQQWHLTCCPHTAPPPPNTPPRQLDIALNFFVGYYKDGVYVDDLAAIARRYVGSPSRFWCGPRQRLKPVAAFGLLYSPRRRRRTTLNGNR